MVIKSFLSYCAYLQSAFKTLLHIWDYRIRGRTFHTSYVEWKKKIQHRKSHPKKIFLQTRRTPDISCHFRKKKGKSFLLSNDANHVEFLARRHLPRQFQCSTHATYSHSTCFAVIRLKETKSSHKTKAAKNLKNYTERIQIFKKKTASPLCFFQSTKISMKRAVNNLDIVALQTKCGGIRGQSPILP